MAARRVLIPPRKVRRPVDVIYRDAMRRGPSRLPAQNITTATTSIDAVETIPSNGLRSLLPSQKRNRLFNQADRIILVKRDLCPEKKTTVGKYANESLYEKRHKFPGYVPLLQLIDKGRIFEAMTRFYLASRSWALAYGGRITPDETEFENSPHIIHDLVERLSRLATTSPVDWQDFKEFTLRDSYWIPTQIASGENVREMDVPTLAFHALIDVYDIGGAVEVSLDATAIASMLHAASYHMDITSFTKCVQINLLRLTGMSFGEAQMHVADTAKTSLKPGAYRLLPIIVLKEIIEGYGRMGVPHLGEQFIKDWSSHTIRFNKFSHVKPIMTEKAGHQTTVEGGQSQIQAPIWLDISSWVDEVRIWSALIKSRANAADLDGARYWLEQYRQSGLPLISGDKCGRPHLTYITALSSHREIRKSRSREELKRDSSYFENGVTRYQAIVDALQMMHQDGAAITEGLLLLCINLHLGFNKLNEAVVMIKMLLRSKESISSTRIAYYRIFFRLHRAVHSQQNIDCQHLVELVKQDKVGRRTYLANLRELFCKFYHQLDSKVTRWSKSKRVEVLTEALRASLSARDLPLASIVLETIKDQQCTATDQIMSIVANYLTEKSDEPKPFNYCKAADYQWKIHKNMVAWLKANDTAETPYQVSTITSPFVENDHHRNRKVIDVLITIVNSRIKEAVQQGKIYIEPSDPEWLQDICASIRIQPEFQEEQSLELALSPIRDRLQKRNAKLDENHS